MISCYEITIRSQESDNSHVSEICLKKMPEYSMEDVVRFVYEMASLKFKEATIYMNCHVCKCKKDFTSEAGLMVTYKINDTKKTMNIELPTKNDAKKVIRFLSEVAAYLNVESLEILYYNSPACRNVLKRIVIK